MVGAKVFRNSRLNVDILCFQLRLCAVSPMLSWGNCAVICVFIIHPLAPGCAAAAAYTHSFFYPWNPLQTYGIPTPLVFILASTLLQSKNDQDPYWFPLIPSSLLMTSLCTKTVLPWDTWRQFHSLLLPEERGGSPQSFPLPAVLALDHPAAYLALVLACVGSLH